MLKIQMSANNINDMRKQLYQWYTDLGGTIETIDSREDRIVKGMDAALKIREQIITAGPSTENAVTVSDNLAHMDPTLKEKVTWEQYKPTGEFKVKLSDETKIQPSPQEPPKNVNSLTTPEASTTELDTKGMPWDARIHAATGTKNADGSWRYRRNIDDKTVHQVEAELEAKGFGRVSGGVKPITPVEPAPVQFTPPPVPPGPHVEMPKFETPVAVPSQPQVAAVSPAPPPTVSTVPAHDLASFKANFSQVLMTLMQQGKIDRPWIVGTCEHFKLTQIYDIVKDEAKLTELLNLFAQWGFVTKVG